MRPGPLDLFPEGLRRPKQALEGRRGGDLRRLQNPFGTEQGEDAEPRGRLGAVDESQALLGEKRQRAEARSLHRDPNGHALSAILGLALAHQEVHAFREKSPRLRLLCRSS